MKKQMENSHEGITWSEMGKQNVQAEKVYCSQTHARIFLFPGFFETDHGIDSWILHIY